MGHGVWSRWLWSSRFSCCRSVCRVPRRSCRLGRSRRCLLRQTPAVAPAQPRCRWNRRLPTALTRSGAWTTALATQADYAACGAAAAKFGAAYSTGASGDTRDRWLSRVLPFLDHGAASEATRSAAFQRGRLPTGKVSDVAVDVKGDSCTGVIRYSDGSTVGPALVRSGQGWIVTGLESWEVEGGQEPSITAPGPNEFASQTPTVGDGA